MNEYEAENDVHASMHMCFSMALNMLTDVGLVRILVLQLTTQMLMDFVIASQLTSGKANRAIMPNVPVP